MPTLPHPLPDDLVELIAQRFRVLGEPMRIRLLDRAARRRGDGRRARPRRSAPRSRTSPSTSACSLQAGIVGRAQGGQPRRATRSPTRRVRALRAGLRRAAAPDRRARRAPRGGAHDAPHDARPAWPLERVLFALAGTVTLLSVALAALVSPWFLLLTAFVGVNQWLYVAVGACPASLVLTRLVRAAASRDLRPRQTARR